MTVYRLSSIKYLKDCHSKEMLVISYDAPGVCVFDDGIENIINYINAIANMQDVNDIGDFIVVLSIECSEGVLLVDPSQSQWVNAKIIIANVPISQVKIVGYFTLDSYKNTTLRIFSDITVVDMTVDEFLKKL